MGHGARKNLASTDACLYGGSHFRYLEDRAADGSGVDEIFLVEGQSNVHTLTCSGGGFCFPTLGLPGVLTWKPEWPSLKCLEAAKRLYFFLDMKDGEPAPEAMKGARKV